MSSKSKSKTIAIECPSCETKYAIVSDAPESLLYCPFCGEDCILPFDDVVGDDDFTTVDEDDDFLNPDDE